MMPKQKKKQSMLLALHHHQNLIINILSRLPIKSIFNCMSVCKIWKDVISSHPEFAKLHLTRSPACLILRSHKHGRRRSPRSLCLLDLQSSDLCSHDAVVNFSPDFGLLIGNFEVVNSCNGLVCLTHFESANQVSIINPLVGDYSTLPMTEKKPKFYAFSWFGFSSKTDEYKVVRFFLGQSLTLEVEVYTLGNGKWRSINEGAISSNIPMDMRRHNNASIEGCLHWIVDDPCSPEFINSFDIGYEQFQSVPAPPHLGPDDKERTEDMMLGNLGGCLYLFDHPLGHCFDIWVMKQYGVQESWNKDFVIRNPRTDIVWYWELYRPISLLSNGEILMSHKSKAMVSCNPENSCFRFLKIYRMQNFEAIPYAPSFVSLKRIVNGEIKVSNIHSREA